MLWILKSFAISQKIDIVFLSNNLKHKYKSERHIFVVAFDNIVIHEANTDATVTVVATAMACALLNPNNTAATYLLLLLAIVLNLPSTFLLPWLMCFSCFWHLFGDFLLLNFANEICQLDVAVDNATSGCYFRRNNQVELTTLWLSLFFGQIV